ncbi:MAG: polysaccharide biosynthesis C-terminal domain-containing protein [Nocardioides sp.]
MTDVPPDESRGQLEKLARRGTASVVGAGFSSISGVLLVVIVTNGFSRDVAGTLFAATSAFLIVESIALLGTDTGLVKWLPAQLAAQRPVDAMRTLIVSVVPVIGLSLGASLALYAAAPSLAPLLVGSETASTMSVMLRALALVLPAAALYDLVVAATRGMGSMRPTVLVDNLGRLGLQAVAVLAVYLMGGGALMLALAWCLPYVLGLVVAGSWLRIQLRDARAVPGEPTPWLTLAREFWAYTAPRAIARVTQTALKRSDVVLVAALASPAQAALYTAATRFIVLGQLFVQSVQQALAPHLSSLFARGETRTANSVFQTATMWSVIASWPFYLVLTGFSPLLMGVFGDGYAVASDVVLILSLTMLLSTACGPVDSVLLMAGRSWLSLRNSTVALTVNVAMNVVLIPLAGIRGAAISWSVAIVVRNVLPLVQVRRHLDMWPATRPAVQVSLLALACFGAVDVVVLASDLPVTIETAVLGIGTLAYLFGVWSWRDALGLGAFRSALRRRPGPTRQRLAAKV